MSSEGKFTRGPWSYVAQADWPFRQDVHILAEDFGVVATVSVDAGMPHLVEQQRSNLSLIASAPEMAGALAELLDQMHHFAHTDMKLWEPELRTDAAFKSWVQSRAAHLLHKFRALGQNPAA